MYFSLITPTPGHERDAAHAWSHNPYAEHQWLWQFLPAPAGAPRTFLFRRQDQDGMPRTYLVSSSAPQSPTAHWQVQSKPYTPALAAGDGFRFELRANPVITTRAANGKSARHDVVMQEKQRMLKERGLAKWADWRSPDRPAVQELIQRSCGLWLHARCERLGIEVDGDSLRTEGYEQHRGKGGDLRFSTVDFSGRLRVADAAALGVALTQGVGHAKAFGCGLLLLRPLG